MKNLVCLFFAAVLGLAAGCASQQPASGTGSTGSTSGITVFGTVDGGVSGARNR